MKLTNKLLPICTILMATMLSACDSNDGTAEQAGETIDEAVSDVKREGEKLGKNIEDACEELTKENC